VASEVLWTWSVADNGDVTVRVMEPVRVDVPVSRRDLERMKQLGDTLLVVALSHPENERG
jgi:hypothetical protein